MVTFPIDGTKIDAFSLTSGPKFYSQRSAIEPPNQQRNSSTYLLTRKVNANRALPQKTRIKLVRVARNPGNNNITKRRNILQSLALQVHNLMRPLLDPLTPRKLLHTRNINTINARTVISQQRRKRPANDLRAIDHANRMSEQPVPIRQDRVVDVQVFEDLDVGEGRAGEDALLSLSLGVEEPDVLVHVEDVAVTEALDVLLNVDDLLQVLVLSVVEDRVVDDDAVDLGVGVGGKDRFFDLVARRFAEAIAEATA